MHLALMFNPSGQRKTWRHASRTLRCALRLRCGFPSGKGPDSDTVEIAGVLVDVYRSAELGRQLLRQALRQRLRACLFTEGAKLQVHRPGRNRRTG